MPVSTDQINVNWTLENLETRIKDNSEYINSLIGLIPPKYYFKNDPNNDETNSNTKINDEFQPNKRKRFSKQELKKQKKEAKKQKALHNDDHDVADDGNKKIKFAKFDFEQKNKKTKKQDNIHLINKLKKKSENFKKLERKDPEKAMIVKEKDAWNKVFRKAEGEKIKDDLKLLKKTVKRGAIKKKKSEKSWNERIETIAKNINEKQEKRKSNIQTRIEEKKKKV
ncbi:18773_t:CDS:2 [Entrophospora sp. SA101]|nr:18773_t:CDS:2 [Entrophospora sp. SA101]CAJ0824046.1 11946_t:CDS:2 [Entrophospora sp. SA101]